MGDGWMDGYAFQVLLSKVSKWLQGGFKHLFGGPVNPWIWEVTFFLQRKRKERISKMQGRGKEKERKRKGNGEEKERKRTYPRKGNKNRKEKEPRCKVWFYCKSVYRELKLKGRTWKPIPKKLDEPIFFKWYCGWFFMTNDMTEY